MKGSSRRQEGVRVPCALLALAAVLIALSGCTTTAPAAGEGSGPAVTTASVPSYMVHVAGADRGVVLLVGRTTCPWCMKTKELLAEMGVDHYWVDLNTLDEAQTSQVMAAIGICGEVDAVPILVINNRPPCIIGFQEARIREALG